MQRTALVGIQHLRGICALAVVVDHASGMAAFPKYFGQELLDGVLSYGAVGVHIFFVLSGFIITIVSLDEPAMPHQGKMVFFKKRFSRIIPLMWVAIISYAVLRLIFTDTKTPIESYLHSFFLIPFGDVEPNPIWTLRHEAIFYIIFAVSFLERRGMRSILFLWVASPIVLYGLSLFTGIWPTPETFGAILLSPFNLEFGAGFLIGLARLRSRGGKGVALPMHPFVVVSTLAVGMMGVVGILSQTLPLLFSVSVSSGLGAGLVALSAKIRCSDDFLSRIGSFLGDASYAIYLFHPHALSALLAIMVRLFPQTPIGWVVMIISVGATIFSIVVHLMVERPLVRLSRRWLIRGPVSLPVGVRDEVSGFEHLRADAANGVTSGSFAVMGPASENQRDKSESECRR